MMTSQPCADTFAIVVAHPGHELMVYHWIERHRPIYCCLTDGSGGAATSRLASTSRLLDDVGALAGPIYGRYTDKEIYRLLLDGRVEVFVALALELADTLERAGVVCVAGDAIEGFNPTHDVCRLIVDGASAVVAEDECALGEARQGRTRHEPARVDGVAVGMARRTTGCRSRA
jgi:hypothetical protein